MLDSSQAQFNSTRPICKLVVSLLRRGEGVYESKLDESGAKLTVSLGNLTTLYRTLSPLCFLLRRRFRLLRLDLPPFLRFSSTSRSLTMSTTNSFYFLVSPVVVVLLGFWCEATSIDRNEPLVCDLQLIIGFLREIDQVLLSGENQISPSGLGFSFVTH